jgi:glycosyltransferase involved in cell wall biosynthesis
MTAREQYGVTKSSCRPLVSIMLPAFKAEGFIGRTLRSWLDQEFDNFELLVSVDSTTDGTFDAAALEAGDDARVQVIQQPSNLGWVENSNFLLKTARGRFGVFAGHDDLVKPDYLARTVHQLEENPDAVLCFSDMHYVSSTGKPFLAEDGAVWSFKLLDGITKRADRALLIASDKGHWWISYRGLFRMSAAHNIGGLKRHPGGEFAADWPWLTHMSLLGEFVRIAEPLCLKIRMPENLAWRWPRTVENYTEVYGAILREVWGSSITVIEKLRISSPILKKIEHLLSDGDHEPSEE